MDKCLVSEAMDKCDCEWCKIFRECRERQIDFIVKDIAEKEFERRQMKERSNDETKHL